MKKYNSKVKPNNSQADVMKPIDKQIKSIAEYLGCNEGELLNEMLPLIQKEREEALLDFARWLYAPTVDYDYSNLIKKYLSQTKGGTGE